jgi:TRAP-type transport system periplasmic protein
MKVKKLGALVICVCLTLVFASLSFLTGCGGATTTQSTSSVSTTSTAASSTTSAAKAEVTLKYYTNFPPQGGASVEAYLFADMVTKASNGKVAVTVYPSEQLGKAAAVLDLLKNGITDIAAIQTPLFPTVFPLEVGQETAMSVLPTWQLATKVRNDLTYGDYGQAFTRNNLKFMTWSALRPLVFFTTKKVTKAEDFKGIKIRTPNAAVVQPFQQYGLVPVSIPASDVYESLQRGIADGVLNPPENVYNNKWYEVTKFYINQNLAYGSTAVVMSQASWDKLPADVQTMLTTLVPQWVDEQLKFYVDMENKAVEAMKASGVEVYSLDAAEAARWVSLMAPSVDEWAAKTEAPGVPAKAMVEAIRKAAK